MHDDWDYDEWADALRTEERRRLRRRMIRGERIGWLALAAVIGLCIAADHYGLLAP